MVAKKILKNDLKINSPVEDVDMNEIANSDDELSESDQELLQQARIKQAPENYDSDDEIYKLNDEDEDEDDDQQVDSMQSDIEGLEDDFDIPDQRAWGKKKKAYYSTDFIDPDYASVNQKDLANAEIEEQEARIIQKRLAEQLDDADFGLEFVQMKDDEIKEVNDEDEIVKTDLTKLSKRQKQALLQKESPEFMVLVNDFKDCMKEARDVLRPFLQLVEKGVCPDCSAVGFIKTKYHLILNYCINISFYLMLKAKRLPVSSHPVIKRLAQYRKLLTQLQSGQGNLLEEVKELIETEKKGGTLYNVLDSSIVSTNKKLQTKLKKHKELDKKFKGVNINKVTNSIMEEEDMDEDILSEENEKDEEMLDTEETQEEEKEGIRELEQVNKTEGKRAITYQIAKNKGLTPHRKKEQRNPRVKHRNKYRKAKIRRKGAVREVRKEITRYAGEISGIKAGVKKGIKLK